MPRRKKEAEGQPPFPESRPENMSEEIWALGRRLGNVVLAENLLDFEMGKRAPANIGETVACLDAARKLEASALARFTKLAQNSSLAAAESEYHQASLRTAQIATLLTDSNALVNGKNGARS